MITAAKLLCIQYWNDSTIPTMKEWLLRPMGLIEMVKLIAMIREKTLAKFNTNWKLLFDFLQETGGGNEIMTYGFKD